MYVCVCNAVTDRDIRAAYCDGACSMRELRDRLGVAGCCGRCAPCARDVLLQCQQERERSAFVDDRQASEQPLTLLAEAG